MNYRSSDLVARLARRLAPVVGEFIVVDNSGDDALRFVTEAHPTARVLRMATNVGYGAAANRGAEVATGEVLVICNPDVTIEPEQLEVLVTAVGTPGVGLAGPRFSFADGMPQPTAHRRDPGLRVTLYELCYPLGAALERVGRHPTYYPAKAHQHSHYAFSVLGALLVVRTEAFRSVGGFDEEFFLYREETDLCRRLRSAGWRVAYEPAAHAVHEGGGSSSAGPTLTQARPEYLASHYRYLAKHRGRGVAVLARVLGTAASCVWWLTGPRRADARRVVRWHLGRP